MTDEKNEAEPSGASGGSVSEPVAWEVFLPGVGTYDIHSFRWEADAIAHALLSNEGTIAAICPLFRQPQPTLTGAEREAVEWAVQLAKYSLGQAERYDALSGLLERLG